MTLEADFCQSVDSLPNSVYFTTKLMPAMGMVPEDAALYGGCMNGQN